MRIKDKGILGISAVGNVCGRILRMIIVRNRNAMKNSIQGLVGKEWQWFVLGMRAVMNRSKVNLAIRVDVDWVY